MEGWMAFNNGLQEAVGGCVEGKTPFVLPRLRITPHESSPSSKGEHFICSLEKVKNKTSPVTDFYKVPHFYRH